MAPPRGAQGVLVPPPFAPGVPPTPPISHFWGYLGGLGHGLEVGEGGMAGLARHGGLRAVANARPGRPRASCAAAAAAATCRERAGGGEWGGGCWGGGWGLNLPPPPPPQTHHGQQREEELRLVLSISRVQSEHIQQMAQWQQLKLIN